MRTPHGGNGSALQPLSAASARLVTSVLVFLSFMLAILQRNFGGLGGAMSHS
jgi:hypothetical protein